jgi:hypothetical protein
MSPRKHLTYSLIRCADEQREECLNVGVLVLDAVSHNVSVRVTDDLSRVKRALPNVSVDHLAEYLEGLPAFFHERSEGLTPEGLKALIAEWGNGIRLSGVRTIAGEEAGNVAEDLFERFVEVPQVTANANVSLDILPLIHAASSRYTARAVAARLRKRGFEAGRDFETDAKVIGRTARQTEVPVWFPLRVSRGLLIDAMDVRPHEERRTIDSARLIASKTDEVLRANGHRVAVVVREGDDDHLNTLVRSLLIDEGTIGGRGPEVHSYSRIDDFVAQLPHAQLDLPSGE